MKLAIRSEERSRTHCNPVHTVEPPSHETLQTASKITCSQDFVSTGL